MIFSAFVAITEFSVFCNTFPKVVGVVGAVSDIQVLSDLMHSAHVFKTMVYAVTVSAAP